MTPSTAATATDRRRVAPTPAGGVISQPTETSEPAERLAAARLPIPALDASAKTVRRHEPPGGHVAGKRSDRSDPRADLAPARPPSLPSASPFDPSRQLSPSAAPDPQPSTPVDRRAAPLVPAKRRPSGPRTSLPDRSRRIGSRPSPHRRPAPGRLPSRIGSARSLLLALLVALATASTPAPILVANAQPAIEAPALSVASNDAVPTFPDGIRFSLVATSPVPIERVELLYAAAGQETLNLSTPAYTPGTEIDLTHDLDLRGDLPPGVDLVYRWRLLDTDGAAIETEPQTVLWSDDRFDWNPLPGERVTVYAYAGDPEFNQAVLETAERTLDRLETDYDARQTDPIRLWVYASGDDFAGALRPNTEPWIAGASYPALDLILAVLPNTNAAEIGRVVPHEISHVLLHQATRNPFNRPPNWLDEGLATYAQEVADPSYPALVRAAAADGRLESVRTLNAQFPYDGGAAQLAYAQSLSVVEFIVETHGSDGMARLIAVFRDGVSYDDAVRQALGVSLDGLDRAWRASLDAQPRVPDAALATDRPDEGGGLGIPEATLLASGAVFMALAAVLAIVAGTVALRRGRLPPDPLDADA